MDETLRSKIEDTDVELLNEFGVSDKVMMNIATEHASRVEALCKIVNPTSGRTILLGIARHLMEAAKQIEFSSFQEPELQNVTI